MVAVSRVCCPQTTAGLSGPIVTVATGTLLMVAVIGALSTPSTLTWMFALPSEEAETTPWPLTVATGRLSDVHVTARPCSDSTLLALSRAVAARNRASACG